MMEIVFATNNLHKIKEIGTLIGKDFKLLSLNDIGCKDEIPEEQETLEGNAKQKADYIHDRYKQNCFADDTGLEIEALDGRPGVYSARYAGSENNAQNNMQKVLKEMAGAENRKARFRTIICLILDQEYFYFEGIVNGQIIEKGRGLDGFGYDPVFIPDGYTETFAEMSLEEKNKISHRALATNKLAAFLQQV
jgi:XTP/dITP diphosphohydrolase